MKMKILLLLGIMALNVSAVSASHKGHEEKEAERGLPKSQVLMCEDNDHKLFVDCKTLNKSCYTLSKEKNWSKNFGVFCDHLPCFRQHPDICTEKEEK
jgi:hypothetical protein